MILIENQQDSRTKQYYDYLRNHIDGVKRSWDEILKPQILKNLDENDLTVEDLSNIDFLVSNHDASKYDSVEFGPYLNYFYPDEDHPKDDKVFDFAWNHHQKCNPHHWQYWLLIRDELELVPQDMPVEYILEMICDWHSFTLRNPESTAYKWYSDNKDKMIFTDATRELVEKYVEYMKEPLSK